MNQSTTREDSLFYQATSSRVYNKSVNSTYRSIADQGIPDNCQSAKFRLSSITYDYFSPKKFSTRNDKSSTIREETFPSILHSK